MSQGHIDLEEVAARLADRTPGRAEATVQSDLRLLLLAAGLNLIEENLEDVVLEAPVGKRRRIDVEVGATVFEVKKDLRVGHVRTEAVAQLTGYIRDRVAQTDARYVGVLTDGVEWRLYHLYRDALSEVSVFTLHSSAGVSDLLVWLEGVLATASSIAPTPAEVARKLGAGSPANALDIADLTHLYERNRHQPGIEMKRQLWAKLLTTALGTAFMDEDNLFIEHTLLVVAAEIVAHAVLGYNLADPSLNSATLVRGDRFRSAQIRGVVEEDFFDWIVEIDGGEQFVSTLARRLSRFSWTAVEHDVMKVLYESIIGAGTRKALGEYYTPDWLAQVIVEHTIVDPLTQRALDPSCGSGTFLFHAVRKYLAAAADAGQSTAEAIRGVTENVIGVDVHPVAVTLARVTYLLAIGRDRLSDDDRPAFTVPVYLGDSIQWGQDNTLFADDELVVSTGEGTAKFANELRFPNRIVEDAGLFDALVAELADAAARPSKPPTASLLNGIFIRYRVRDSEQPILAATYEALCKLHDTDRDHIWGYYVRNLARPLWLAHPSNRVDVLIGNPPWLSYRFMPSSMKSDFRSMSQERGFWAEAADVAHQDLSALFVARAVEQYLRPGGRFAFVMPLASLSRRQFGGFRSGRWASRLSIGGIAVAFETPWDLHQIKPSFFPVPAAVVLGSRTSPAVALTGPAQVWSGRIVGRNPTLKDVAARLTKTEPGSVKLSSAAIPSPYGSRFTQGAALAPRVLVFVQEVPAGPLGAGAGRVNVRSHRSANEKEPYKSLLDHTGSVEKQFVLPVIVGDSVLPFRTRMPARAVIPWDGSTLEETVEKRLDQYAGLAQWWRQAEDMWITCRGGSNKLDLLGQLDYRRKLSLQFSSPPHRVVYTKSGMYLAAVYIDDPRAVIDQSLYWAAVSGPDEARFLTAILNSDALLRLVQPLQARGEHNPRHFAGIVWRMPIPLYDSDQQNHRRLVALAKQAEGIAATVELPTMSFQALRRRVRQALADSGVAKRLDSAVDNLFESQG